MPTRSARLRPSRITATTPHDALKAERFVLYAAQGELSETLFRISTVGNLIVADIERMLHCSAGILSSTH